MSTKWFSTPFFLAILAAALGLLGSVRLIADSVYQNGVFELGDAVDPAVPGIADIAGSGQPGPDWADLFRGNSTYAWRDDFDESGYPGANGVPDFLDGSEAARGRRDAVFVYDTVSAGSNIDSTALLGSSQVGPRIVDVGYDLVNAYAYTAFGPSRDLMLYVGLERLANADASIVFEFNRRLFVIDGGQIVGSRMTGDLRISAEFSSGILSSVTVRTWEGSWVLIDTLPIDPSQPSEQCNAAETLCAVCNGASIDGGLWTNYDDVGVPTANLVADTFMEMGLNLSALLGIHSWENYYDTRYASMQVSSYDGSGAPADYGLGQFLRASRLAQ